MSTKTILRRFGVIIAAMLVALLGLGVASASASPGKYQFYSGTQILLGEGAQFAGGTWYGVDLNDACRMTHPGVFSQAVSNDLSDAASLVCVTPTGISIEKNQGTSFGDSITVTIGDNSTATYNVIGGLNLQDWCRSKHPGSSAVSWLNSVGTWVCIK